MSQFETWFDGLVRDELERFVSDVAEDVREKISTHCPQYHDHTGGHAPKGAPPYRETGLLLGSIKSSARVVSTGNLVGMVSTDVPYAPNLENGAHPFMRPAALRAASTIAQRLSAGLAARLPRKAGGTRLSAADTSRIFGGLGI